MSTNVGARLQSLNNAGLNRRPFLALRWVLACGLIAASCAACGASYKALEVHGVVVDAESKKPLQGVGVAVRYRERLSWWKQWMFSGALPWKPRYGRSRQIRTDANGRFSVDVQGSTQEAKGDDEDAWPRDILFVEYFYCGYEAAFQRARDDEPLFEDETLLIPGEPQRVEMHQAQPGSRYHVDKCCQGRTATAPGC